MIIRNTIRKIPILRKWLRVHEFTEFRRNEILSLIHISKLLNANYFPWTNSSISPTSIRLIINEIIINQRSEVIEFGAGISTLYIARILKDKGGSFISVEQDRQWMDLVASYLKHEGLDEVVTQVHVPIEDTLTDNWYSLGKLEEAVGSKKFDLALVDAPVSCLARPDVRTFAGEFLKTRLMEDFAVLLDDIDREGEQNIAKEWCSELNWNYRNYWPQASVGVFRPKGKVSFAVI